MTDTVTQSYGSCSQKNPEIVAKSKKKKGKGEVVVVRGDGMEPKVLKVTDVLVEAAKDRELIYKPELTDSPYINGEKNTLFLNRSMMTSDALADPIYGGAEGAAQRDLSRYQRYLSPSQRQKAKAADREGVMTPEKLLDERKSSVRGSEFSNDPTRRLDLHNDSRFKSPEKRKTHDKETDWASGSTKKVQVQSPTRVKADSPEKPLSGKKKVAKNNDLRKTSEDDDEIISEKPAKNGKSKRMKEESAADRTKTDAGEKSRPKSSGEKPSNTSKKFISTYLICLNFAEKKVDSSQLKSPQSDISDVSSPSGNGFLCPICVNKRLKRNKDLECEHLREQMIRKEREELQRLETIKEADSKKMKKAKEAARADTKAVGEALDKKFQDQLQKKRTAGKIRAEEERSEQEQDEKDRQAALQLYNKHKKELKAELEKQIQEKQDQRDGERKSKTAHSQSVSLKPGKIDVNGQLKEELVNQIEKKLKEKKRESEVI